MSLWGKLLGTALSMATTAASTASKSKKNTSTSSSSKNNYSGSATGVGTYTSDQDRIKAQMNANSKAWYETTDPAERDRLHKENVSLSETLGGGVSYDGHTGTWSGSADKPRQEFSYESAPSYTSKYQDQIDELLNGILNRDKFSYDATKDPLYAQYQDQYQREGQRAMKDTLGEVAANTGGLASSWATTAASQAGDYYASKVSDKVPELYQMAYQMYLDDIDNQVRDLGLVENMDNTQYGRYRDTMSDWRSDRDFAYGQYRDDVGDDRYQNEWNYQVGRDQISDNRYNQQYGDNRGDVEYERLQRQAETLAAYGDFSGYKALGYSDDQIRQMEQTYQQQLMTSISGGGSGGGSGSSGGNRGGTGGSGGGDIYQELYNNGLRSYDDAYAYLIGRDYADGASKNIASAMEKKMSGGDFEFHQKRADQAYETLLNMKISDADRKDPEFMAEQIGKMALNTNAKLSRADVEYLFRKFGYDPSQYLA